MEATGIWSQVQTFKFLVSLITFQQILSFTKGLSDQLQCRQLDLAKAADLMLAMKTTVKEFRTDSKWDSIYKYALHVARLHSIAVEPSLQSGIVLESTGVIYVSLSVGVCACVCCHTSILIFCTLN